MANHTRLYPVGALCAAEACEKLRAKRQWCHMHYRRLQIHGDLNATYRTPEERFRALIGEPTPEGCWPWLGKISVYGYGHFTLNGQTIGAHRYAVMMDGREPGETVDHLCHDPSKCWAGIECPHRRCVNPAHLAAAVPTRDNTLRGGAPSAVAHRRATCAKGHELTPANTRIPEGHPTWRVCRTCRREDARRQKAKKRLAA